MVTVFGAEEVAQHLPAWAQVALAALASFTAVAQGALAYLRWRDESRFKALETRAANAEAESAELRRQMGEFRRVSDDRAASIAALEGRIRALQEQNEGQARQIQALTEEAAALRKDRDECRAKVTALEQRERSLQAELAGLRRSVQSIGERAGG